MQRHFHNWSLLDHLIIHLQLHLVQIYVVINAIRILIVTILLNQSWEQVSIIAYFIIGKYQMDIIVISLLMTSNKVYGFKVSHMV